MVIVALTVWAMNAHKRACALLILLTLLFIPSFWLLVGEAVSPFPAGSRTARRPVLPKGPGR
jgi:hypothetical protein